MKKIIMVLFVSCFVVMRVEALAADSYIIIDGNSGRILDGNKIHDKHLIASTTKILTALIIIENVNLNEIVEIDDSIYKSFGSSIYLEVGEKLSILDLLYGLLLRSGNDSATVLANHYAGSMENFASIMNKYARQLGMDDSRFYNSSGLDDDYGSNVSTAYDMALLMKKAIMNPIFLKISGSKYYSCKSNKKSYTWKNKNKLLFSNSNVIAGKTGYTELARRTLVTAAQKDDRLLIMVTFNDGNDFNDHFNVYQKYFKNYQNVNLCDNVKKINDPLNIFSRFAFYYDQDCNMLLNKDERDSISYVNVLYENVLKKENSVVGNTTFFINNKILMEKPIRIKKKESFVKQIIRWVYD